MTYQTHDPAGVQQLLATDPEWVYIDVRSTQEFEQGHVPGSYNIPLLFMRAGGMQPNLGFLAAVTRHFPKARKIVFGCKSGGRSARACELLEAHGYAHLVNMSGGFHGATDMSGNVLEPGWAECGFDSTRAALPGRTWRELEAVAAPK
ncbi:MAG: rhodanese-like domain-containing protein [Planctomycetes bacterium]|nr:rhodanese-like domain-containing protein [Planctomycetota bacterium]